MASFPHLIRVLHHLSATFFFERHAQQQQQQKNACFDYLFVVLSALHSGVWLMTESPAKRPLTFTAERPTVSRKSLAGFFRFLAEQPETLPGLCQPNGIESLRPTAVDRQRRIVFDFNQPLAFSSSSSSSSSLLLFVEMFLNRHRLLFGRWTDEIEWECADIRRLTLFPMLKLEQKLDQ